LASMQEESQSTQLLKKERENADVQTSLDQTRSSVGKRLGECRKKKTAFEKRQEELRKIVQENEQFIKDTDMKIEKAEKKAKEDHLECRRLDEEIKQYCDQLDNDNAEKELELKKIEQNMLYKEYLESVVKEYEEDFENDIENLLNRYRTLEDSHTELLQANQKLSDVHDETSDEWRRVKAELQNERLILEGDVHHCSVQYEKYRSKSIEIENRLNAALEDKVHKESNVGVMQMAIEQLFTRAVVTCRLQQRKNAMSEFVTATSGNRVELVLSCVKERMEELQWILEEATTILKAQGAFDEVLEEKVSDGPEVPTFCTKLPPELKNAGLSDSMSSQTATKARTSELAQPSQETQPGQASQAAPGDTVFLTQ